MSLKRDITSYQGDIVIFRDNVFGVAIRLLVISSDGPDGASELKHGLRSTSLPA